MGGTPFRPLPTLKSRTSWRTIASHLRSCTSDAPRLISAALWLDACATGYSKTTVEHLAAGVTRGSKGRSRPRRVGNCPFRFLGAMSPGPKTLCHDHIPGLVVLGPGQCAQAQKKKALYNYCPDPAPFLIGTLIDDLHG